MDNLNILIVEDESLVALELSNTIKGHKYNVVDYVTTPKDAIEVFQKEKIDLIIMDINLKSDIDGIDLYKSLNTLTPVIYATAYQDETTITKAVQTNPLGYLIKPYNEQELFALLKLATYKIENNIHTVKKDNALLDIGEGYFYNLLENRLFFNEMYIKLSPKETKLLNLLIETKGEIVSFETIENEVWEMPPNASSLRTLIYRLRGKLEHKFISNELNHGIRLERRKK